MPEVLDSWRVLGSCSCARCCCCPSVVYYPPSLAVNWHGPPGAGLGGSTSFSIYCSYLGCPRGFVPDPVANGGQLDCDGDPDEQTIPGSPCVNEDYEERGIVEGRSCVVRCHGCSYVLLGADGEPNIKETLLEPYSGGYLHHLPADTPWLPFGVDDNGHERRMYIITFGIFCSCWNGLSAAFPAIPTAIQINSGLPCGWEGFASGVLVSLDGVYTTSWDDPTYFDCPTTDGGGHCVFLDVWSMFFNRGIIIGDGSGTFPDPPYRLENPLDPFKFSCCPLRIRFLQGQYEPAYWCGIENGAWPDPSEWPPTHFPYFFPWNFPLPFCTDNGTGGGCGPGVDPGDYFCGCFMSAWSCQDNSAAGGFGYVDISGDAQCHLPEEYDVNCLNANLPDDHPKAC